MTFIEDSYQSNSIKLLADYRLNKDSYIDPSELTNILFGIKKWSDFLPEPTKQTQRQQRADDYSGESCSDIDEMISVSAIGRRTTIPINKIRADYTKPEQREIVAYLVTKTDLKLFYLLNAFTYAVGI